MTTRRAATGFLLSCYCLICACAAPSPTEINTPQGPAENYPPVVVASPERRQAAEDAWRAFLKEFNLPETAPDLEPVLDTPHSLPPALSGRIALNPRGGELPEVEAKEVLRKFLARARNIIGGPNQGALFDPGDLSLIAFSADEKIYRAVFEQQSYPYRLANNYGELRLAFSRQGALLQMSSRLVPALDLPDEPTVNPETVAERMVGREFTYTSVAGQPLSYRVARREDVEIKSLVVYPKPGADKLTFHLALPFVVGSGTTWTVFVDAITGVEIEVKQNFAT